MDAQFSVFAPATQGRLTKEVVSDWVHGFIHRIEGDDRYARYWYRKARKPYPANEIQEMCSMLVVLVSESGLH